MKAHWTDFWNARTPRERLILGGGALLLLVLLGYAWLWLPVQRESAQLRAALPALRAQAQQVAADRQAVAALRARPAAAVGGDLAARVDALAVAGGLRARIEAIVPLDAQRVRVRLPEVAFDDWITWLDTAQKAGVRVEYARVEASGGASGGAGAVRAEAVLATGE